VFSEVGPVQHSMVKDKGERSEEFINYFSGSDFEDFAYYV
jgi:hypothetical protein